MNKILIGLAALPFFASSAWAASTLADPQLDTVTAGQILGIECPGCTLASSSSTSANGVTTTISSTVIVGGGSGGGSSGGGSGGGGSGGGGGGSSNPGPSGPSVVTTIPVPASATAIINGALATTITPH